MKYRVIFVLLLLVVFLACITVSSSVSASEKISKPLIPVDKKNVSTTTQMSLKGVGSTLFDGTEIIQDKSVIAKSLQNLKNFETVNFAGIQKTSPAAEIKYQNWNLRELADYVASNHSHTIGYGITETDGVVSVLSSGVLGYSSATDQIIGDKYEVYSLNSIDYVKEHGLEVWQNKWRLIIEPDDNRLIIQTYDGESPSPSYERTIDLNNYEINGHRYFYGLSTEDQTPLFTIRLFPDPIPTS